MLYVLSGLMWSELSASDCQSEQLAPGWGALFLEAVEPLEGVTWLVEGGHEGRP